LETAFVLRLGPSGAGEGKEQLASWCILALSTPNRSSKPAHHYRMRKNRGYKDSPYGDQCGYSEVLCEVARRRSDLPYHHPRREGCCNDGHGQRHVQNVPKKHAAFTFVNGFFSFYPS
jgi:hypothetical protein